MQYNKNILVLNLILAQTMHNYIVGLYKNSLYEDNWNDEIIHKFEIYLAKYNDAVNIIKEMMPSIPWTSMSNKKEFESKYKVILDEDLQSFNLVKIRHEAYTTYRGFRNVLINHLNNAVGFVTGDDKRVFEYFNDEYNDTPLYNNKDMQGNITVNSVPYLLRKFYKNIGEITIEINKKLRPGTPYKNEDIEEIFKQYVKAREAVFEIFNMITSTSEVNGYKVWHNQLYNYITDKLKDVQLKQLYNATKIDNNFLPCDDYQLIMDDKTWNAKGIYESWFDDELRAYSRESEALRKKDQIKKINMMSPDANACRVATDGKHVYSSVIFYPGDIVEICPTKIIDKSSLYSKDMRDVVFEVIPNKEWVLPFGYCQYYDLADINNEANVDFIWDPIKRVIVIKAINKIPKHTKLYLNNIK